MERLGFPPLISAFPGIDVLGANTCISPSVSVMRVGPSLPMRNISIGDGCILFDRVRLVIGDVGLSQFAGIRMGNRVLVNVESYLSGEGGLTIGDDVLIGPHVKILSAGHGIHMEDVVIGRNSITHAPVVIGRGAWVGAGAIILQGVTVGEGAVVAAGAVVNQDVPPRMIAAGVPARVTHARRFRDGADAQENRENAPQVLPSGGASQSSSLSSSLLRRVWLAVRGRGAQ